MLVLPLNSVINPLLYDNTLTDFLNGIVQGVVTRLPRYLTSLRAVQAEQTQNTAVDWGDTVGEGGHSIKTEPQLVEGNEIESVI